MCVVIFHSSDRLTLVFTLYADSLKKMGEKKTKLRDFLRRCSFCVASEKKLYSVMLCDVRKKLLRETEKKNSHGNLLSQTRDRFISDAFLKSCENLKKYQV